MPDTLTVADEIGGLLDALAPFCEGRVHRIDVDDDRLRPWYYFGPHEVNPHDPSLSDAYCFNANGPAEWDVDAALVAFVQAECRRAEWHLSMDLHRDGAALVHVQATLPERHGLVGRVTNKGAHPSSLAVAALTALLGAKGATNARPDACLTDCDPGDETPDGPRGVVDFAALHRALREARAELAARNAELTRAQARVEGLEDALAEIRDALTSGPYPSHSDTARALRVAAAALAPAADA